MMLSQRKMTAPERSSDVTILPSTAAADPESAADAPRAWRTAAINAYAQEVGADSAQIRAELATRVYELTGYAITDDAVAADSGAQRATVAMDGMVFQLHGHDLILLRPCAYCGAGRFVSAPLSSHADLGYAISGWQPYHPGCEPVDAAETDW